MRFAICEFVVCNFDMHSFMLLTYNGLNPLHAGSCRPSCQITIRIPLLPLHIILLNQPVISSTLANALNVPSRRSQEEEGILLNILLDIRWVEHASTLRRRDDLCHQFGVSDSLSALHNPHNGRLRLVMPVRGNTLVRFLIFLFGLFELDLVDLDPVLGVREAVVDGESIVLANTSAFRRFTEDSVFGTC